MAQPRLFRLKSQRAPAPQGLVAQDLPIARVIVDTGVFHLDSLYDYTVPENYSHQITLGTKVQVPFGSREVEALVVERRTTSDSTATLKSITKVLSSCPVATENSLALIRDVATRWAAHPWDVIRSAIPPRVALAEKDFHTNDLVPSTHSVAKGGEAIYLAFEPHMEPAESVAQLVRSSIATSTVLIVAPDQKDIEELVEALGKVGIPVLRIDSAISRRERYLNFLKTTKQKKFVVIGSRNSIFAPIPESSTIIIYKESSPDFFEIRTPGWNVRDVALMRKDGESSNLIFCGYVPSLEIGVLIDTKQVRYIHRESQLNVKAFPSPDSSLLPERIFSQIRAGLKQGSVLFVLPRKGYANAMLCAHCKNLAQCECGARLHLPSQNSSPSCRTCGIVVNDWACSYCGKNRKFVISRGIDRAAEEISRAFPSYPIILSYGDVIKSTIEEKCAIVLSTPGAAPKSIGGYSAIVILEGLSYFAHDDSRAIERANELFFESAAKVKSGGAVLLAIDESHPVVSALYRWNPTILLRRELNERKEIHFPPYAHSAVITVPTNEAVALEKGLQKAIKDLRLPDDTKILGPSKLDSQSSKIVVISHQGKGDELADFLHELMRRRSISKKSGMSIRIDPYSL